MTAIEILQAASTLSRAARHLQSQNRDDLPRSARQALAEAQQTLLNATDTMLHQRPAQ